VTLSLADGVAGVRASDTVDQNVAKDRATITAAMLALDLIVERSLRRTAETAPPARPSAHLRRPLPNLRRRHQALQDPRPLQRRDHAAGLRAPSDAFAEDYSRVAVEVDPAKQVALAGDGSPMEDGAHTRWLDLDEAIASCIRGEIVDLKTELCLRRLREHLG